MSDSYGAPQADGLLPTVEPLRVSPAAAASIPNAVLENWGYLLAEANGAARASGDHPFATRLKAGYEQVASYIASAIETRTAETEMRMYPDQGLKEHNREFRNLAVEAVIDQFSVSQTHPIAPQDGG